MFLSRVLDQSNLDEKIQKKKKGVVRSSEICLFCNLYDIFTKYASLDEESVSSTPTKDLA